MLMSVLPVALAANTLVARLNYTRAVSEARCAARDVAEVAADCEVTLNLLY